MKKSDTLYESTTTRRAEKHANQAARIAAKEATVMQKGASQTAQRKPKKTVKKGQVGKRQVRKALPPPLRQLLPAGYKHAMDWARLLEHPFVGDNSVKCPFNFNPAPSLMSVTVTTVNYMNSVNVTQATSRQLILWPGHGDMANTPVVVGSTGVAYPSEMDEVAYHQSPITVGGTNYNIGPCFSTSAVGSTLSSSAAIISASLTPSTTSATAATAANFEWAQPYPITANITKTGHQRWKQIAMGVRIRNITPAASRGGSVITVQPTFEVNMADFTSIYAFESQPSFRNWGDGTEEITLSWIPRPRDLSYWHLDNGLSATGVLAASSAIVGPGILIYFTAPIGAGYDQQYEVTQISHWEVAGTSSQIFSGTTTATSISDGLAKMALGQHSATGPGAAGFAGTLSQIVRTGEAAVQTGVKMVGKAGRVAARFV